MHTNLAIPRVSTICRNGSALWPEMFIHELRQRCNTDITHNVLDTHKLYDILHDEQSKLWENCFYWFPPLSIEQILQNSDVRKFCIGTVLFAAVLDDLTRFYSNNMFCMIILEGQVWLVHLKCWVLEEFTQRSIADQDINWSCLWWRDPPPILRSFISRSVGICKILEMVFAMSSYSLLTFAGITTT